MALFNDIESLPSQFPEDLRVLVVDHDTDVLNAVVEMSIPSNYQVTTCSKASFAFKLLMETKGCVDVVLIEAQMPDMDSYDFVRHVTQQINIPVIMMCDDGSTSAVMKAVANGACEYWIKPLIENQIKNMWQCVARKFFNENKHNQSKRGRDDNANYQPLTKKNRISWTPELHRQFLRVVNELGLDKAKPKAIHKAMNVPGLTKEQVASHLQRVILDLKSSTKETHLKNRKSKRGRKKSKFDQYDVPNETQLSSEAVHSIQQDPENLMNSAIQCNDNSHAQQDLMTFDDYEDFDIIANIFTDQSYMIQDDSSSLYEAQPPSEYGIFN